MRLLDRGPDPTPCTQWSIWFEFFLLCVMLGTCFVNAFERARFIYLTYLSLVTSLLTITSRNFINSTVDSFVANGGTIVVADTKQSANSAAAAGAIMLCITNYCLIIFIGLGERCGGPVGRGQRASPCVAFDVWQGDDHKGSGACGA